MISFPLWTNRIEYWGRFWEGEKASEETRIYHSSCLWKANSLMDLDMKMNNCNRKVNGKL